MNMSWAGARYPDGWRDGEADAIARAAGLRADGLAVVDLTQAEFATVELEQRVRSSLGRTLEIDCRDGAHFAGTLADCGNGWVLLTNLAATHASAVLVTVQAITQISGLSRHVKRVATADAPAVAPTAGIGAVLRSWIESREKVKCGLVHGLVEGSVARVGKDAVDVAAHPLDRGPTLVDPVVVIPTHAMNWVLAAR